MTVSIANMSQVWLDNGTPHDGISMAISTLDAGGHPDSSLIKFTLDGNTYFRVDSIGNLYANGNANINISLDVGVDATIKNNTYTSNANVYLYLDVGMDATVKNTVYVLADTYTTNNTYTGNANVYMSLDVGGNVTVTDNVYSNAMISDVIVANNLYSNVNAEIIFANVLTTNVLTSNTFTANSLSANSLTGNIVADIVIANNITANINAESVYANVMAIGATYTDYAFEIALNNDYYSSHYVVAQIVNSRVLSGQDSGTEINIVHGTTKLGVGSEVTSAGAHATYVWCYDSAGSLYFGAGNQERVRITSSGNVGIGTTGPTTKLHVMGPIRTHPTTFASLTPPGTAGAGARAFITDSPTNVFGTYLTVGGGVYSVPLYSDGIYWYVG